jgi:hypothetical protein
LEEESKPNMVREWNDGQPIYRQLRQADLDKGRREREALSVARLSFRLTGGERTPA